MLEWDRTAAKSFIGVVALLFSGLLIAAPVSFEQAKVMAKQKVYFDRAAQGTTYCGCNWKWVGRSGGRIDFESCGYEVRAEGQRNRAERLEWEHIVPASNFGRARQCWQDGGRANCNRVDPVFNAMEADLHNLTPSVGEINSDRSNFSFGVLTDAPNRHGACDFKVDFKQRSAEPADVVKGKLARVYFYMHDRYDMNMSKGQQNLLMTWDRAYPVSSWELERDSRIKHIMGHSNPFVTGDKTWRLGHKNTGEGAETFIKLDLIERNVPIRGNRNSRVYHLPVGCQSYELVSPSNIVEFPSESAANDAGYRKAGNCK